MKTLHPHQTRALGLLRESLRTGSRRPMLQAPTGAGKTTLAAAIINSALRKGNRTIFTVPAISLVDQTVREFYDEGIRDVGVIQADHPMTDPSKPVQIASIQTLVGRTIPEAQLVLIDEAHRAYGFVEDWMTRDDWLGVPFIGLSATPWTKGLGRLYDRLIIAATTAELIDAKLLAPFRVFAPSKPDLSRVRTVSTEFGRDYSERDLSRVMSDRALVADVVRTWLEKAERRPTLCFAVDRVHAKTLQAQFREAGVACGYVDALTPRAEREEIRKAFHARTLEVVCNVGVLTTGVDWDVRCVSLCRPTKSEILYTQILGRALRTAPGKDYALILDHSTTTLRLGFVTDIHHDALDGGNLDDATPQGADASEAPKPRECPECHYVRPAKVRACPACGHVAERSTDIEVRDGSLVDITARREAEFAEQISFLRQLKAYALVKGKTEGWVAHRFKAKWGAFPNHPRLRSSTPAAAVSPEVKSWLVAQNIRWAKGKGRAA